MSAAGDHAAAAGAGSTQISEREAELYDRQIRLWGAEKQRKLRETRVLLLGCGSIGTEVAKNLILTGVASVHICDNSEVEGCASFFFNLDDKGPRSVAAIKSLQRLNPMVEVKALSEPPTGVSTSYDVIGWVSGVPPPRANTLPVVCATTDGDTGFVLVAAADQCVAEKLQAVGSLKMPRRYQETLVRLQALASSDLFTDDDNAAIGGILGGIVAQQILNVTSGQNDVIEDFLVYSLSNPNSSGQIYRLADSTEGAPQQPVQSPIAC